jgi:amidase
MSPSRRDILCAAAASPLATLAYSSDASAAQEVKPWQWDEATLETIGKDIKGGRVKCKEVIEAFLSRIEEIDRKAPALNSVIEINPEAIAIAEKLDKVEGEVGPLHGIPVLIKDNIDTADRMQTTAGSLAMVGAKPSKDSGVARKLRAAGAVIIGKTNLSEWANIRSSFSTSGWSGRGALTRNPYALDRNTSGSSSGTGAAVAASLCVLGVGTETDGSIVSPSSVCGLVGIKPTVGLISRAGIIPISESQDTAGPMTRTVRDAAVLLGVLAGPDPDDKATADDAKHVSPDYTKFLDKAGLKGARLGILRKLPGFGERTLAVYGFALDALRKEGAILVDEVDPKTFSEFDEDEMTVLLYELKAGLNAYLTRLKESPIKSLADVIAFNEKNKARELHVFGQDNFIKAEACGPLTDKKYLEARDRNWKRSRDEGIDAVMEKHKLDAIIAPTNGPAWLTDYINGDHFSGGTASPAAVAGYPAITVPMGDITGLPVGLTFFGKKWSEPTLVKLAYAFEQATKTRKPPRFSASVTL